MIHVPLRRVRYFFPSITSATLAALCIAPARAYDLQPPVLHGITTTGSVNALKADQHVTASLDMADDLSGITHYLIKYESPSGRQYVLREKYTATPLLAATPDLEVGTTPYGDKAFGRFSEPGVWRATLVTIQDADNNGSIYDANQLQALGSTTFNVTNTGGYDIVPPTLKSGVIDTPTISLSTAPNGTRPGTLPYAGAHMLVSDAGNGAVSGLQSASLMFCWQGAELDCGAGFVLDGTTNHAGVHNAAVVVGSQMQRQQALGQYVLTWMVLQDNAGNLAEYVSTLYGGDTDFSKFFPGGATIEVKP